MVSGPKFTLDGDVVDIVVRYAAEDLSRRLYLMYIVMAYMQVAQFKSLGHHKQSRTDAAREKREIIWDPEEIGCTSRDTLTSKHYPSLQGVQWLYRSLRLVVIVEENGEGGWLMTCYSRTFCGMNIYT